MELVIDDAKFFKDCIEAIVNLVDEGVFEVSATGMRMRTMDPSQIALVDFFLPKEAFSKYDFQQTASLGINLVDLSKVLGRARAGENLTITVDENQSNKLVLEFQGEVKRDFKLPLLDLSSTMAKELKIPFAAKIKLKGASFKDLLKDAALLSSHVAMEANANAFIIEAHGDAGDLKTETKKDSPSLAQLSMEADAKNARALFPLEYLNDIARACPDDAAMEISLKSDAPVKIAYIIQKAQVAYFLAPRVESI